METVPPMISVKDLSYLEDMMGWNFTLAKKVTYYSNKVTDPALKETLLALSNICKTHYEALLNAMNIGGSNGNS